MHWKTSRGLLFSLSRSKTLGRAPDYRAQQAGDGYTLQHCSHLHLVVYRRTLYIEGMHFIILTSKDFSLFANWL